jgi:hypothetical protein
MAAKAYLGDGVYAEWDGYGLILSADEGVNPIDTIIFEPEVYAALAAYVDRYITQGHAPAEDPSS